MKVHRNVVSRGDKSWTVDDGAGPLVTVWQTKGDTFCYCPECGDDSCEHVEAVCAYEERVLEGASDENR